MTKKELMEQLAAVIRKHKEYNHCTRDDLDTCNAVDGLFTYGFVEGALEGRAQLADVVLAFFEQGY